MQNRKRTPLPEDFAAELDRYSAACRRPHELNRFLECGTLGGEGDFMGDPPFNADALLKKLEKLNQRYLKEFVQPVLCKWLEQERGMNVKKKMPLTILQAFRSQKRKNRETVVETATSEFLAYWCAKALCLIYRVHVPGAFETKLETKLETLYNESKRLEDLKKAQSK